MIVVDASVIAPAVADDGPAGDIARAAIAEGRLSAPELLDIEVVSYVRRAVRTGQMSARRAEQALDDLTSARIARSPHGPLIGRMWELRDNLTPYDASYVALAEANGSELVTADAAMAKVPGINCEVRLLGQPARGI